MSWGRIGSRLAVEAGQMPFNHQSRRNRGVGVKAQTFGVAEKQRKCRLGSRAHLMIQVHDHAVHFVNSGSHLGHFCTKCPQIAARHSTQEGSQNAHGVNPSLGVE